MTTNEASASLSLPGLPADSTSTSKAAVPMATDLVAHPQTHTGESKNSRNSQKKSRKRPTLSLPARARRRALRRQRASRAQRPSARSRSVAHALQRTSALEKENLELRQRLQQELEQKRLIVENSLMRHILRNLCQNVYLAALIKSKKLL